MFYARKISVLMMLLLLGGCGFSPMYGSSGQGGGSRDYLSQIAIDNIPDRTGQYLRNRLIDRLQSGGMAADPAYTLSVAPVQESRTDLDITKSADATSAQLDLSTTMVLRKTATGESVVTRSLKATTSYNILSSQFTTRVSEDNARLNALDDLARQIEQQVLLYRKR